VKEYLREIAVRADNDLARVSVVREYLQARILESIQDRGLFSQWAFVGGTALRFLFSIPRFSEDLDFSLIEPDHAAGFRTAMADATRGLEREGYRTDVRIQDQKPVAAAWIRFPGLLHELGFSPHPTQVLSIRVEVDTRPPSGAGIETTMVRRHVVLNLCHHDRASLLAGKLHAVLSRPWAKGRDLFDLAWYLADRTWPAPNLNLLNASLAQTRWRGPVMTEENWRDEVRERLAALDWKRAQDDVRPFLERERDMNLVTAETLPGLLR
jgi:hypothetical protein